MDEILTKGKLLMKFLDLFWFFLDGNKSSGQVIAEKKQPVQQVRKHESEEASYNNDVEEKDEFEEFEEFFD